MPLRGEDGIRVLHLQAKCQIDSNNAGNIDTSIRCNLVYNTLSHYDRDPLDFYIALSYVWGDPTDARLIDVDGVQVSVTANLYAALRDIQDSARVVPIWVDALCINQNDNIEKACQVMSMHRIYAGASRTIIYLGELTDAIEAFLKLIDVIPAAKVHDEEQHQSEATAILRQRRDEGATELIRRPWFTRVWVYQEVIMSRDPWIQCGNRLVRWTSVADYIQDRHLAEQSEQKKILINMQKSWRVQQAQHIDQDLHRQISTRGLLDLVTEHQGFGVTDPRDMIFAFVGITKLPGPKLVVDYRKSCINLYIDFAETLITSDKEVEPTFRSSFSCLCLVSDIPLHERMQGLPSWVPDLSKSPASHLHDYEPKWGSPDEGPRRPFHWASKEDKTLLRNPPTLASIGYEADFVLNLRTCLHHDLIPHSLRVKFQEAWDPFGRSPPPGFEGKGGHTEVDASHVWIPFISSVHQAWRACLLYYFQPGTKSIPIV
ncbi:MAG: hypothetical protein Q9220_006755 [cf. Caloplaca sp. 1 TL-2023]